MNSLKHSSLNGNLDTSFPELRELYVGSFAIHPKEILRDGHEFWLFGGMEVSPLCPLFEDERVGTRAAETERGRKDSSLWTTG